jgi:hypothetical protein
LHPCAADATYWQALMRLIIQPPFRKLLLHRELHSFVYIALPSPWGVCNAMQRISWRKIFSAFSFFAGAHTPS